MAKFSVYLNDPSVPVALVDIEPPPKPKKCPSFSVQGHPDDQQSAQVYFFICHTLEFVNRYLADPMNKWAGTKSLTAFPQAGTQLNAYYDRQNLKFFSQSHPSTGKMVHTCESSDVVCHELGHAVLDALRPDLWSNPAPEIPAFHEAFGDCLAILSTLHHDEMVNYLLNQTGGNLKQPNAVERIAEEMGNAVYHLYPTSGRSPDYLRSSLNDFKYVNPASLPNNGPDNILTKASHSLSRVFSGAFYNSLVLFHEENVNKGTEKVQSLIIARERLGRLLLNSVRRAPLRPNFFESVAKSMMTLDLQYGGEARFSIVEGFKAKNIIQSSVIPLTATRSQEMKESAPKVIKLSDYVNGDNPLYACEVEVADDSDDNLSIVCDGPCSDAVCATRDGVDHLVATDKVCYKDDTNQSTDKEFRVENGRLVRNFFSCH